MKLRIFYPWEIVYLIMFLSIFKPAYAPDAVIAVYRGIQIVSLVWLSFQCIKKIKINSQLIILISVYYGVLLVSTINNNGSIHDFLLELLTSLLLIFWLHVMVNRNPKSCVDIMFVAFEVLIYMNFISVILFPNGLYRTTDSVQSARYGWILGHQSIFSIYAAPAICVATLKLKNNNNMLTSIRSTFLIAACVGQIIIFGSANNIICLVIILLGSIVLSIRNTEKFSFLPVYIGTIVMDVVVTVMQTIYIFEPIIVGLLHRTMTLTNRTYIWTRALSLIAQKWQVGYGIQDADTILYQLNTTHAHNQYLQCLYLGGIPLLVVFCIICFISFHNLRKSAGTLSGRVMISAIVALMVQMISEVYFYNPMGKMLIAMSFYFIPLSVGKERIYCRRSVERNTGRLG